MASVKMRICAEYARLFNAVVLACPDATGVSLPISTFESILFESGRPVLIAPPVPPQSFGERILIAWNGSLEIHKRER